MSRDFFFGSLGTALTPAMAPARHGDLRTPPIDSCGAKNVSLSFATLMCSLQGHPYSIIVGVGICFFVRTHAYAARHYLYTTAFSPHRYTHTHHVVQLCETNTRYEYVRVHQVVCTTGNMHKSSKRQTDCMYFYSACSYHLFL